MYGSAGTGKTLILTEALKIKLSKLLSQGRRVRILATTFFDRRAEKLRSNLKTKYFVNVKNVEVMSLKEVCRDLDIYYNNGYTPRDTINKVITSLSDKYRDTDTITLLLVDEVWPSGYDQPTPDWRHLKVRENVIWLLGLAPRTLEPASFYCHLDPSFATSINVLSPLNNFVLTRHLVIKHRNCSQIRNLMKTINFIFYFEMSISFWSYK